MANDSSDTSDQTKQIWFNCEDYQELLKVQLRYLRNELPFSPTYPDELKLESPSILSHLINLTEIHQLFIVWSQTSLTTETSKQQRESVIAFGLKEHFTNINPIINSSIHLCIYDCSGHIFYCTHVSDTALLDHFLEKLEKGLNSKLYKFILENCYYITAVDSEYGRKDFLLPIFEQWLDKIKHIHQSDQNYETLQALQLQNPAQILPNLYLSSETPAKNLTLLKQLHINHILNLTGFKHHTNELRFQFDYPSEFTILHIKIADEMDVNISDHFDEALRFISDSIDNDHSNRILVHCEAGISRSSTIVIAYLMQYHHQSLKNAYEYVKQRKNNINPNLNFFKQLIQFEKQLYNNQDFQSSFTFQDYLVEYMLEGPAVGFTRDQILTALEKTNYDPHAACNLLFFEEP
jgi:protein-tyrosine phosphatase